MVCDLNWMGMLTAIVEAIISVGAVLSAFLILEKYFSHSHFVKAVKRFFIGDVQASVDSLGDRMLAIELFNYREVIDNENIDITERIRASDAYLAIPCANGVYKLKAKALKDEYYHSLTEQD